MSIKFPRRLWIVRSPDSLAYQVCKNDEEFSTPYLSVAEHHALLFDLTKDRDALRAQVKELLEMQHCDAGTMQKFQQSYEFHRDENIKLRAALEEIAKYDCPAEGGVYTKVWMRLGKIASDALKR